MNKSALIVVVILFISSPCIWAQPDHPVNGPIGGVVYMLLSAVAFGVYSLRRKRKL